MTPLTFKQAIAKAGELIDGKLPAFAWPGGYTIAYYAGDGELVCAGCATRFLSGDEYDTTNPECQIVGIETYDEGPTVACANCNALIESSYGEDEESL